MKRAILSEKVENKYVNFNFLGSWQNHYKSWLDNKLFPTLLIKYEDLEDKALLILEEVQNFINKAGNLKNKFDLNLLKSLILPLISIDVILDSSPFSTASKSSNNLPSKA